MLAPPAAAPPERLTDPGALVFAMIAEGTFRVTSWGSAVIVNVLLALCAYVASTATLIVAATYDDVVATNVPVDDPAGIVTFAGTDTAESELERSTTASTVGVGLRVTVPVTVPPAAMLDGVNVTPEAAGACGSIATDADN